MGTLAFSDIEITPLSADAAVVLGRWHLKRANDEPHGRFTLIFRRLPEGWRIVHDHTSAAPSTK
jgi:ketosteroid isomerase-like protein